MANAQGYSTKLAIENLLYSWTKKGANEPSIYLDKGGLTLNTCPTSLRQKRGRHGSAYNRYS